MSDDVTKSECWELFGEDCLASPYIATLRAENRALTLKEQATFERLVKSRVSEARYLEENQRLNAENARLRRVADAARKLKLANDEALGEFRPRPDIAWRELLKALTTLDEGGEG